MDANFKKALLDELNKNACSTRSYKFETIPKNGTVYEGVSLVDNSNTPCTDGKGVIIAPVARLDEHEKAFLEGKPVSEIAKDIMRYLDDYSAGQGRAKLNPNIKEAILLTENYVKAGPLLIPFLTNKSGNPEGELRFITTPLAGDLEVGYAIDSPCFRVKITCRLLENWGITVEDVRRQAMENLLSHERAGVFLPGNSLLKPPTTFPALMVDVLEQSGVAQPEQVQVLYAGAHTCALMAHGATLRKFTELLPTFSDGYTLYPYGGHELILMPLLDDVGNKAVKYMLRELYKHNGAENGMMTTCLFKYANGVLEEV